MSDFKADEPAPVGNYDLRKREEEGRLDNVLERLNTLFLELSPPGPSSAAGSVDQVWTWKKGKCNHNNSTDDALNPQGPFKGRQ